MEVRFNSNSGAILKHPSRGVERVKNIDKEKNAKAFMTKEAANAVETSVIATLLIGAKEAFDEAAHAIEEIDDIDEAELQYDSFENEENGGFYAENNYQIPIDDFLF